MHTARFGGDWRWSRPSIVSRRRLSVTGSSCPSVPGRGSRAGGGRGPLLLPRLTASLWSSTGSGVRSLVVTVGAVRTHAAGYSTANSRRLARTCHVTTTTVTSQQLFLPHRFFVHSFACCSIIINVKKKNYCFLSTLVTMTMTTDAENSKN